MVLKCGIVGLPNVGKSTLFNALTSSENAEAANYPFCTIEPNIGVVAVPDKRLNELAKIADSKEILPAYLEFVDIAGLVKGASEGEGLGNKFLSHIREVDCIIKMVRCFDDKDVIHVESSVDPVRDIEIIETELILSDFESVEKRLVNIEKKVTTKDKEAIIVKEILKEVLALLSDGKAARLFDHKGDEVVAKLFLNQQFITAKKILYICNVGDEDINSGNEYVEKVRNHIGKDQDLIIVSAKIESELATISDPEERGEFLEAMGITDSSLDKMIKESYKMLNLMTYFTVGPKEARAWTVKQGTSAPSAAGVIHTDFERGFICAETVSYDNYIKYKGEKGAKESGNLNLEGKAYIVKDGDVIHFRFNV